jgi:outer membrane receptor for ferrienterochelin and colicin
MGFDSQLSDFFEFDVTSFYKDVFDLAGVRIVHALPQPYSEYYNVEYARIQGIEFTMSKALSRYWSSQIGYTFQIAKGTASTADAQYQRTTPLQLDYFLDQDQRHSVHADLAFSFPSDFGFVPMRDFEVSGVFSFATGTPYTPTDLKGTQIGLSNSARLPSSYTLDGRIGKDFRFLGMSFSLNCDITNVLNSDVITSVFAATGKPDYTGVVITPYQFPVAGLLFGDYYYHPACDYNHDGFITQYEQYASYLRAYTDANTPPTYYGPPRKIRVGLSLSF